jgi:hypothetical protein
MFKKLGSEVSVCNFFTRLGTPIPKAYISVRYYRKSVLFIQCCRPLRIFVLSLAGVAGAARAALSAAWATAARAAVDCSSKHNFCHDLSLKYIIRDNVSSQNSHRADPSRACIRLLGEVRQRQRRWHPQCAHLSLVNCEMLVFDPSLQFSWALP